MRSRVAYFGGRPIGPMVLASLAALLTSACSSDTLRFDSPFARAPWSSNAPVDPVPTGSIPGAQPLSPPGSLPGSGAPVAPVAGTPLPAPSVPLGGPSAPAIPAAAKPAPVAAPARPALPAARPALPPMRVADAKVAKPPLPPNPVPARSAPAGLDRSLVKVEDKKPVKAAAAPAPAPKKPPAPAKDPKKVAALAKPAVKSDVEDDDDVPVKPKAKPLKVEEKKPEVRKVAAPVEPVAPARAKPTPVAVAPKAEEPAEPPAAKPEIRSGKFRWPAKGRVITGFGTNGNEGINIAVPEGTPVRAAEDGVVAYAGDELKRYGNLVLVRHPDGYVTAYAHNGEITVKKGDKVKRGQPVAKAGQTGNVVSPQVHFEIRKGATPVDPSKFLEQE